MRTITLVVVLDSNEGQPQEEAAERILREDKYFMENAACVVAGLLQTMRGVDCEMELRVKEGE